MREALLEGEWECVKAKSNDGGRAIVIQKPNEESTDMNVNRTRQGREGEKEKYWGK